jgi:dipeptidyl aminopeptidase/acylaminoacyl peptidase
MLTIWRSPGHSSGHPVRRFIALAVMLAGVIAIPIDAAGAAERRLRVDDFFEFESVQSPVISPDGGWVAYTLESIDAEEDKRESSVWMVNRASGESLRMTRSGVDAHTPRWSPEGTYLSFLSGADDDPAQVWLLNRSGGEARQLTSVKRGVTEYEWSPDGKRLALVIRDADPAANEGDSETPRPWVIDRLQFKNDGVGYLDRFRTHLYVLDLASEKLVQITGGDYDDSDPAWSPDGRSIAFVSNRSDNPDANYNTDLWLVRADEVHTKQSPRQLTTSTGPDEAPVWSPDGKRIAYRTMPEMDAVTWYAMEYIAVVSLGGGEPSLLTKGLDRRAEGPQFQPDGSAVYFRFEDQRSVQLARVPVSGGEIEPVIDGKRCVDDFALAADGVIVALVSELDTPGNLYAVEPGGLRPLTRHNDALLAGLELAEVESTSFASPDGTEIQGFIYKPPGFSKRKRYPTLLRIHGGPWAQYDYRFDFRAQLFAAHSYVVVLTNPRGSTGRGMDFRMGSWQSWGSKDVEDVLAGVDHAVELGYADPDRLGVGGWSWGGILTNYVITQTDRFKAAVSIASYGLNASNYGHDLWQRWWERELGLPWENRPLWEQLSTFNKVEKIVTPTLWMCGEKDWNVPAMNSEQMYQAMKRLGRDTLLVIYPDQDHGISRPSFRKDLWERNLAWYDAYLSR